MRPRDLQKEEAIRKKAVEIVVREGFDGLTMQKLAREAGVSPATIYIYYKDRDDLLLQVSIHEELRMFHATLEGFHPEMPFDEGLRNQWRNRAKYYLENPQSMYFMEQIRYSRFNEEVWRCAKGEFVKKMSEFVHHAIERGELVRLPIEVYWAVAFAPLYQLIKFHINKKGMHGKPFVIDEKTLDLAVSLVIKGLKP